MKTRTLLLLAIGCGLAILLAGGIVLWRVARQAEVLPASAPGVEVDAGPWTVTVEPATSDGERVSITVNITGPAVADAASAFQLFVRGKAVAPSAGQPCPVGPSVTRCVLVFPAGAASPPYSLFFARDGHRANWQLPGDHAPATTLAAVTGQRGTSA